ncbi:prepilin-type N-terminal cleavage/methylation domain-containing protein [Clostridium sp. 1001271B_151109_B4]|uniref:prepilin-type N-terminal cleavage/methylation domain-containing protein n=1 Tax=Clostridium sp. 1001271B_151109_B4 TaxID=2787148 RepID=UPI0018AB6ED2|nr:prepilin-type N-terminal cleavage/methylation domain-containing protein [Clostridium sp. 1001271B_151109_B4]
MNKNKRGYTLIESIIVIAIIFILGGITIVLSFEGIKDYYVSLYNCYYEDRFDNALLNIESLCNSAAIVSIEINSSFSDIYSSEINGNNIVVKFKETNDNQKTKIIHLSNGKLMMKTISYESGIVKTGNNTIIDKVNDFTVIKKGKLIYYCISTENSGVRIRCI